MHVSNCLEVHKVLLCILRERMRSERVDLVVIAINEISPFFFLQVAMQSRPLFHAHTLLQVATQYYRKRIGGKNI